MTELRIIIGVSSAVCVACMLWMLWAVLPLIVLSVVSLSGVCGVLVAVRFASCQIAETLSPWLVLAEKKQAVRMQASTVVTFPANHCLAIRQADSVYLSYVPIARIGHADTDTDTVPQLSQSVQSVHTALSLLSGNGPDELCVGTVDGVPVRKEWRKLKAVLILGLQDGGKTNTAIWLLSQVLLQNGRLAVIDKHARSEDDSMYSKIKAYEAVFDVPIGDVPTSAMRVVKHARKVLDARLNGAKCGYPLLLVVDEFSAIMRQLGTDGPWADVASGLVQLLEDFNYEGRKHKCYAICIGQASNASRSGGSEIRDTFNTRIVHRMKEKQAQMLSMTDEKQQIAQLNKGECFVDIEGSDVLLMQVPYVDDALIAHVARSIGGSVAVRGGFSVGSDDDSTESTNGLENLSERVLAMRERGLGKGAIINELWGAKKGGSEKYKLAEMAYEDIIIGKMS